MWKKKAQPTDGSTARMTVLSSDKRHRRRKVIIIVIIAWVIVAAACAGIAYWYHQSQQATDTQTNNGTSKPGVEAVDTSKFNQLNSDVVTKQNSGDTQGAADLYNQAAKATSDKGDQSYLYASETAVYVQANQLDQALQSALDAYNAQPSESSATLVADTYERLGNKDQAIVYYQKAIDLINPDDPTTWGSDYYQSKIDELKS